MYLFIARLGGASYVTTHSTLDSVEREASWVLRDFEMEKFNWVSLKEFDNDCCLDDYPDGSALIVELSSLPIQFSPSALKARLTQPKSIAPQNVESYISPFTGQRV